MLRLPRPVVCLVMLATVALVVPAGAQMPDKFTNLQVLPKDITKPQLMQTMRGFSFSLGVRCEHCHVEKHFDADDKETKRTARQMLKMVDGINKDYIAKLGRESTLQVQCVTCHRGLAKPQTINSLLGETIEKKGVAEAVAQYKELRQKYYGGAAYDFSETPLNQLAESLLAKKNASAAAAIMEMNVQLNANPSGWTSNVLAMSHQENGEIAKARADYERILEKNPQNDFAKKQLEELSKK